MLKRPEWDKPVEVNPLSKLYAAAADAIEQKGHAKYALITDTGAMCIMGAINYVATGDACDYDNRLFQGDYNVRIIEPLEQFTGGRNPIGWNNAPERTKEEVVAMLRKAALVLA
jgi:hypothetical protein